MKGILFNIQKFSIHDGPGIRTVVFFKGCHLQCLWCSNPESQPRSVSFSFNKEICTACGDCMSACREGALNFRTGTLQNDPQRCTGCGDCVRHCLNGAISFYGREYSVDEVVSEVLKDKPFYDKSGGGVTLSGGEVFLQFDFAAELCRRLALENIAVAVESSLTVSSKQIEKLINHVDIWLVDLKHYDEKKLLSGTGGGFNDYKRNLKQLVKKNCDVIIRIPVIPGFNHTLEDAEQFVVFLQDFGISSAVLLPFHQYGEKKYELLGKSYFMKGTARLREEDLAGFAGVFERNNIQIQIGG
ncbi:MAG: glycyl-radical enzyme activating protein [Spirochaetales bacterium]|nr:glycyl-radical enzyme activating protein [Spirochaetales bacterium]